MPTRHQKLFAPLHITWNNTPRHKTSLQHPPTVAPELLKLPKPSPSQGLSEEASPNLKIQSPGRQLPLHEEWKTLPLFGVANMHMGSALWETILKFGSMMWSEFFYRLTYRCAMDMALYSPLVQFEQVKILQHRWSTKGRTYQRKLFHIMLPSSCTKSMLCPNLQTRPEKLHY